MPIVAVNLSPSVFTEVMRLVQRGDYSNPAQFLEVAAFNQLAMERSGTPASGDGGGSGRATADTSRPAPIARRVAIVADVEGAALAEALERLRGHEAMSESVPSAETRPQTERIWGQVNRLFPMKLACRWLVASRSKAGDWGTLDALGEQLGADAATLGSALEAADAEHGRKRDELLSTGLPRMANLSSRDRFLTQFIARTNRANEIYPGAICQFALATFVGDRVVLTDRGIDFARLANPVLDEPLSNARRTLSDEERGFLLEQVARYMPAESRDFMSVLDAIVREAESPDALLAAMRPVLPAEWTQLMARTHVSGLVARACELGLVRRDWEGRRVRYATTEATNDFVELVESRSTRERGE